MHRLVCEIVIARHALSVVTERVDAGRFGITHTLSQVWKEIVVWAIHNSSRKAQPTIDLWEEHLPQARYL
jgi:hypothetical protein